MHASPTVTSSLTFAYGEIGIIENPLTLVIRDLVLSGYSSLQGPEPPRMRPN